MARSRLFDLLFTTAALTAKLTVAVQAASPELESRTHGVRSLLESGAEQATNVPLVLAMAAAVVLGLVGSTAVSSRNAEPEEKACVVQTVVLLTGNLAYTVLIPSSYLISQVVGQNVAYSGTLIGVQQAGATVGAIMMWLLLQSRPEVWRERFVIFLSTGCNLAGATLFFLGSIKLEEVRVQPSEHPLGWVAAFILFARFVDGLGLGVILQLGQVTLVHLIPSSGRPGWMATNQLAAMLGIGFGPMLASGAGVMAESRSLLAVGTIYISIAFGAFLAVGVCYPDADSLAKMDDTQASQGGQFARQGAKPSVVLICAALTMAGTRGFVVSSLEAATSILLEIEYSWGQNVIGMAIGLSFLSIIPLKLAYNALQERLLTVTWARVMALLSILGSLLLFTQVGQAFGQGHASPYAILVADSILFPTIFLGDALTAGIVMLSQHLFPAGTLFDANHVVLFREIFKGLGRTCGPPLARIIVNTGGQDSYALQQASLAVLFLLLLETCVRPNILPDPRETLCD